MRSTPKVTRGTRHNHPSVATAALFLVTFAIYALTMSTGFLHTDVFGSNWTSWHIATTGTPWIDGVRIPQMGTRPDSLLAIVHTSAGHSAFVRFPGTVAAALPAYFLFGRGSMSVVPGSVTAALLSAIAVCLMFNALRRYLSVRRALASAVVFGFATPVWTISANLLWPHTITVLGIAGMAWAASTGRWWWAGVFGGIALSGRVHTALIAAFLGLGVGLRRRDPGVVLRIGLTSTAFLLANCAWCRWTYGSWNPLGGYGQSGLSGTTQAYASSVSNQLGMWVSPDRGILVWTPIVLLLLPALARSWRELPDWSRSLLVGGLVYTLVNTAMITFTGGDAFYGYRYGLEFLASATPALALSQVRMGAVARILAGPVLALEFFAFALGAISPNLWVPESDVWHRNAFIYGLHLGGPASWVLVALAAIGGLVISVRSVTRVDLEGPEPEPDQAASVERADITTGS